MMRDGDHDRLPRFVARREGALRVLDRERGIAADEIEPLVAHQRAGQLPGFGEHLEAVADAMPGRAAVSGPDHPAAARPPPADRPVATLNTAAKHAQPDTH